MDAKRRLAVGGVPFLSLSIGRWASLASRLELYASQVHVGEDA
ncbi:MAG: hypothetical protein ACQEUG_14655 [Pseudomonadota bacterium]